MGHGDGPQEWGTGMGPRNGARVWAQWKEGARGWLIWKCVIGSSATDILFFGPQQKVLCFDQINQFGPHREQLAFQPQKPVRTSQRMSCVLTTKTSSNIIEKILYFNHKNQFGPHREHLVFQPQKPVWTSQKMSCFSTTKTSSDITENVLCFNHKNQFRPPLERPIGEYCGRN
jgi:hypothetical protein